MKIKYYNMNMQKSKIKSSIQISQRSRVQNDI